MHSTGRIASESSGGDGKSQHLADREILCDILLKSRLKYVRWRILHD